MNGQLTNDVLTKDLYVLSGQFIVFEGQMTELHKIISEGFTKIETKLDDFDKRVRVVENAHAQRTGQHSAFGWLADGVKVILAALAGALGGHFFK